MEESLPQTPAPPGSSHQALQPPGSGHQTPATRLPPPGSTATRLQPPGSNHQAPATRLQPPGSSHQVPDSSPATRLQPPGSSHQSSSHQTRSTHTRLESTHTRLDPSTHDSTHTRSWCAPPSAPIHPIQKRAQLFAHFACFLDIQLFFPSCGGPKHKTQKRDAKLSESQKHRNTTPSVKAETPKHRTPETQSGVDCW